MTLRQIFSYGTIDSDRILEGYIKGYIKIFDITNSVHSAMLVDLNRYDLGNKSNLNLLLSCLDNIITLNRLKKVKRK